MSDPRAIRWREADAAAPGCFHAGGAGGRVLVAVHGISRNAAEVAARFAAHPAFADVTIVAPLFEREVFGQYQQMTSRSHKRRADEGLTALLERFEREGHDVRTFDLFGFSGGAQFAHRFALFHPERVSRLLAASAGWYTMPDQDVAYPYGMGAGAPRPHTLPRALRTPITVAVGGLDTRRDSALRRSARIDAVQGVTRKRRAKAWVAAMNLAAEGSGSPGMVRYVSLRGGTHDFGQCAREAGLMEVAADCFATGRSLVRPADVVYIRPNPPEGPCPCRTPPLPPPPPSS